MRTLTSTALAALTTGSLLWSPAGLGAKSSEWIEVRSEHFIVRSDSPQATVLSLVRDLERFRSVMEVVAGVDLSEDPTPPLTIYLFTTISDYQKNLRAYGTLGFYTNPITGGRAFLASEDIGLRGIEAREVLFHEYTHHVLNQFSPYRYPVWYNEGFAEYLSTIQFQEEEGRVLLGDVVKMRGAALERYPWIPCGELIGAHGQYAEGSRSGLSNTSMQYAQGWIFAHYLNSHREMGLRLEQFIRRANATPDRAMDVFEDVFGLDSIACNKLLKDYWDGRKLQYVSIKMPEVKMEVRVRKMKKEEARAQIMEARILSGQYKGTLPKLHKAFSKALDADVRPNDMMRYLVAIALYRRDYEQARALSGKLVDDFPQDARALVAHAAVLLGGSRDEDRFPTDRAVIERAIALYERAIDVDPSETAAYVGYANAHLSPLLQPTAKAVDAILAAERLHAGNSLIRAIHARLRARRGEHEEASAILDDLKVWARTDRGRTSYAKQLKRVEDPQWPAPIPAALYFP